MGPEKCRLRATLGHCRCVGGTDEHAPSRPRIARKELAVPRWEAAHGWELAVSRVSFPARTPKLSIPSATKMANHHRGPSAAWGVLPPPRPDAGAGWMSSSRASGASPRAIDRCKASLLASSDGDCSLLYAQPLVRVAGLPADAVDINDVNETISISFGTNPLPVARPFTELLRQHLRTRPNLRTGSKAEPLALRINVIRRGASRSQEGVQKGYRQAR